MKKSILICGLALLGLTSCKKTWTCECKTSYSGTTMESIPVQLQNQTKKEAKTQCDGYEDFYSSAYSGLPGVSTSCNLK